MGLDIAFFGSSLVSAYWNGAATYYRGLLRALHTRGHRVTFYEPDAWDRQAHRDIEDPEWARVVVYRGEDGRKACLAEAERADLVVKASGVGVYDAELEEEVAGLRGRNTRVAFWDVDAPATLGRVRGNPSDPLRALVRRYDAVFTYSGGPPVVRAYQELGARACVPIYNALDPATHFPVPPDPRFDAVLAFLGNRLPDREERVQRYFFDVARAFPSGRFLLGGSGWEDADVPDNVVKLGHVYTRDHNAFNCTPRAVVNIHRHSMDENGWSPATRVFEAMGAGACLISDPFLGVEEFFEPGREILLAERPDDVLEHVERLTGGRREEVGAAARARVVRDHTYWRRAETFERALAELDRRMS